MGRSSDAGGAAGPRNMSCLTCSNREKSEFCVLGEDLLRTLDRAKTCNVYRPGQVVFYQGNACLGLYCIESGEVALRKADEAGHEVIVRTAHGGQTLGYRSFFAGTPYQATAEVLSEARICFVDRSAVRELLDHDHRLGMQFLSRATTELEEAEEARLQIASWPVRTRLAHYLLALKDRRGRVGEDGTLEVELPLNRRDLASLLGARPETISRAVRTLGDEGIARFDGQVVRIPDLDNLLDEVESAGA